MTIGECTATRWNRRLPTRLTLWVISSTEIGSGPLVENTSARSTVVPNGPRNCRYRSATAAVENSSS